MKVVVYAICKNEAQFVDRWMDSMGEADQVVVLDTGSTDGSRALAERYADILVDYPWNQDFAAARNAVLEVRCGPQPVHGAGAGRRGYLRMYRSG